MKLTKDQEEKFKLAARILEENQKATVQYKVRSSGITNGNSERKKRAMAELLGSR